MQVKKQQLELDMKQWTGSKLGKEYVKAVYCHSAYLTYMQSASNTSNWTELNWIKHYDQLWTGQWVSFCKDEIQPWAENNAGDSSQEYLVWKIFKGLQVA